jgi:hypothetical protein
MTQGSDWTRSRWCLTMTGHLLPLRPWPPKAHAPESGSDPRRERRARPRDRAGVAREAVRAGDQQDWAFRHRPCARVTSILFRLTPPSSGRRHGRGLAGEKRLQRAARAAAPHDRTAQALLRCGASNSSLVAGQCSLGRSAPPRASSCASQAVKIRNELARLNLVGSLITKLPPTAVSPVESDHRRHEYARLLTRRLLVL